MNHPDERVALQAVEFWSTVCEEEIDLAIEAADVSRIYTTLSHQKVTRVKGARIRRYA